MLTWEVGGLYLPLLGFSQAPEFMCRRVLFFFASSVTLMKAAETSL